VTYKNNGTSLRHIKRRAKKLASKGVAWKDIQKTTPSWAVREVWEYLQKNGLPKKDS